MIKALVPKMASVTKVLFFAFNVCLNCLLIMYIPVDCLRDGVNVVINNRTGLTTSRIRVLLFEFWLGLLGLLLGVPTRTILKLRLVLTVIFCILSVTFQLNYVGAIVHKKSINMVIKLHFPSNCHITFTHLTFRFYSRKHNILNTFFYLWWVFYSIIRLFLFLHELGNYLAIFC